MAQHNQAETFMIRGIFCLALPGTAFAEGWEESDAAADVCVLLLHFAASQVKFGHFLKGPYTEQGDSVRNMEGMKG